MQAGRVGPLAPVAANDSEERRVKNRRQHAARRARLEC